MSTSRWLTWAPKVQRIAKVSENEPPKPSKSLSGGFEGAHSELFPTSECSPAELDAAKSQVFQWVGARCVRRRNVWGSERSLWHDYVDWGQQRKLTGVSRTQFSEIIDLLFTREMDGWWGIAMEVDILVAERHIM
jgi:hypothetical protein